MDCKLPVGSCAAALPPHSASQRTQNFIIQAPTPQLAQAVAEAAERYRRDLAMHWLGKALASLASTMPDSRRCRTTFAAQGVTTYNPAPVRDFQMEVIGTPQRILDSVLPHEITHTILATYFGRPLPRWADEGICTTVEHAAERKKHEAKLQEFLTISAWHRHESAVPAQRIPQRCAANVRPRVLGMPLPDQPTRPSHLHQLSRRLHAATHHGRRISDSTMDTPRWLNCNSTGWHGCQKVVREVDQVCQGLRPHRLPVS